VTAAEILARYPRASILTRAAGIGLVVSVLVLAGCSSHASSPDRSDYSSLSVLCTAMGATFAEESGEHELFTSDEGYCGSTSVAWFSSSKLLNSWLEVAEAFGGVYVVGDRWALTLDSPTAARQVQARVGGTVRS
jgi:hypothetical protein